MSNEMDYEELAEDLLSRMERIEDRLDEMKAERKKLYEANSELVRLVEQLEDELEGRIQDAGSDSTDIAVDGYQYSYQDGWQEKGGSHKEDLDLDENEIDVEEVDEQIEEIQESIRRLKRLHH